MSKSGIMNQPIKKPGASGQKTSGYMPGLDGLRALAVFAVIAYHLNLSWAPGGLLGVCLFFVLSGYLITNILLNQWQKSGSIDLKDFWLRRAKRLLPALFVMLIGVVSWLALFAPDRLVALKQEVISAIFYISNWYQIFHQVSYFESFGPQSPLNHLWSLAVEEQFYLFWPLLLGLGLRYLPRRRWVIGGTIILALASVMAMALIYLPGHDPSRVYYGTDTRAFSLLTGAVLAMIWPSHKLSENFSGKKKLTLDLVGIISLFIVLYMIWQTNQYQPFLYRGGLLLFSLAAVGVVAALAHPDSRLAKLFSWRPLCWLGACSYGIYLWHYPVIVLTSPVVDTGGFNVSRALMQIVLSIALAALSKYIIEDPIRYGRRIAWRRTSALQRLHKTSADSGRATLIGIFLVFCVLCISVYVSMQITSNDMAESQSGTGQVDMIDNDDGDIAAGLQDNMLAQDNPNVEKDSLNSDQADPIIGKADTGADKEDTDEEKDMKITGDDITVIGDSVLLDTEDVLQELLPGIVIDAKIGRQMYEAEDVISALAEEGELRKIVIIELGTNGSFTEKQLTETLDCLDGAEQVVLVNSRVPRSWETSVNETLEKVVEEYPDIILVDWYTASSGHDDYFYPDGVHLNPTGAKAYGEFLVKSIIPDEEDGL